MERSYLASELIELALRDLATLHGGYSILIKARRGLREGNHYDL